MRREVAPIVFVSGLGQRFAALSYGAGDRKR